MTDPLDDPLLGAAIESVTRAMAHSFDEIWMRPNARQIMADFLGGQSVFLVRPDEVLIVQPREVQ